MKIWLDDCRPMPEGYDIHCYTAEDTIELLENNIIDFISFDHDLATDTTGHDVAKWIEKKVFETGLGFVEYRVHSANPVGVKNIIATMESARREYIRRNN